MPLFIVSIIRHKKEKMDLHTPIILILLSSIIILSYFFTILSRRTSLPSVLLLMVTGIGIKYITKHYGIEVLDVSMLVKTLGAVGLIMIVLEAALDLKMDRSKLRLVGDSFSSALFIFLISALTIGFLIKTWLFVPFDKAFLYAIPLSIISSAIVIPSTSHLGENTREFIVYESSFSDILGIMVFNFMLIENIISWAGLGKFFANVGLVILLAVITTFLMLYIIVKVKVGIKFFLLFSILSLLYGMGELIHLPSLLVVLVFGLVINNYELFLSGKLGLGKLIRRNSLNSVLEVMKSITAETSFLIRTFFFILFGYTVDINVLIQPDVWKVGSAIIVVLLLVRYFYIKVILKTQVLPLLLLMPRGLVTILLFYSIPVSKSIGNFNEGILFFVVAASSILMMIGLLVFKEDQKEYYVKSEEVI